MDSRGLIRSTKLMTRDEFEQNDTPMVVLVRYDHDTQYCYTEEFQGVGAFTQAIKWRESNNWCHDNCSWDIIANDAAAAEYTEVILDELDMEGFDHGSTDTEQDDDAPEGFNLN